MSSSNGQIRAAPPPVQPPTIYQHLYTQQKPPQFIQVVTPDGNVGSIFAAHAKPETLEALKQRLSLKRVNTSPVESGDAKIPACNTMGPRRNTNPNGKNKNNQNKKEGEVMPIISDSEEQSGEPVVDFETKMRQSMRRLTTALLGDEKQGIWGITKKVADIEQDLYGGENPDKGLKTRVKVLEEKANKWSNVPPPAIVVDDWASAADTNSVDKSISSLQDSNAVLVGIAAQQQREIKSLCNELYIQQDRQNYLNLHLGGVSEVQGKTPKEEAVQFFKEILQMSDITVKDFVKAYRKTEAKEYEDSEKDKEGRVQKFQVKAPGVMFVCLASETIRDQAIGKARGLGGKQSRSLQAQILCQ